MEATLRLEFNPYYISYDGKNKVIKNVRTNATIHIPATPNVSCIPNK